MNTQHSGWSLLGAGVAAVISVMLLMGIIATYPRSAALTATTPQPAEATIVTDTAQFEDTAVLATTSVTPAATAEPTPCLTPLSRLPNDARIGCGIQKQTAMARMEQEELLTAEARPPLPPLPTLQGPPVPYGYVPESAQRIFAVDLRDTMEGNTVLRRANSVWHIGAVSDGDDYNSLNLYTLPSTPENPVARLGTMLIGNDISVENYGLYARRWVAPSTTGTITITQVTGPIVNPTGLTGLVTFITSTGQTGAFDLGLQQWTIGNMMVVATPVPTIAVPLPTALPTPSTDPYPVPLPSVTVAPSLVATAPSPP